jgi:hypothetical protein
MSGTKTSLDSPVILLFAILLCILVAAGCISSSSAPVNPPGNISVSATAVLPVTTLSTLIIPAPAYCPNESNTSSPLFHGESFIRISPVPHHYIGDTITFDGITNLAPGEMITINIKEAWGRCSKCQFIKNDSVNFCCANFYRMVAVGQGDCGANTWSLNVDTSIYDFGPGDYLIETSGRDNRVVNSSDFRVSGIPKPNITFNNPENDPNEYAIRFSGQVNTGNGPDEKLLLMISSDSGKKANYTIPVRLNGTGYYWNFTLKKSVITPYNFYTVNITSQTNPEIEYRNTFMYNNLPGYG